MQQKMNENANEKTTALDILEQRINNGINDINQEILRLNARKDALYSVKSEIESIRDRFHHAATQEGATPK